MVQFINVAHLAIQFLGILATVFVFFGIGKLVLFRNQAEHADEAKKWIVCGLVLFTLVLLGSIIVRFGINGATFGSTKNNQISGKADIKTVELQCNNICESADAVGCPADCEQSTP